MIGNYQLPTTIQNRSYLVFIYLVSCYLVKIIFSISNWNYTMSMSIGEIQLCKQGNGMWFCFLRKTGTVLY